jgi:hypothetical protein
VIKITLLGVLESANLWIMKGQWLGDYTGTNAGTIMVNVDEFPSYFQGVAYLRESNLLLPGSAVAFRTKNKSATCEIQVSAIFPIDPKTGIVSNWEYVKQFYGQNVVLPTSATATVTLEGDFLTLTWSTNLGTTGKCTLPRSKADKPSDLVAVEKNWEAFKDYVETLEHQKFLFRGQNAPWRLRTAFHRAGRADLTRFLNEDIQTLHKRLSARTKHVFNLDIPNENGAFFNLVQHHGYPTPLLDWTYSPYVAAFFAYRGITNEKAAKAEPTDKVRIHVFDQLQWRTDWKQVLLFLFVGEHLSIGEFMAIENERMIPQQAATTITNVDDIETYIRGKEANGKQYLWAIDLPVRDRRKVIQELSYMGITASSLFPGLDGACEELKERNFDI